MIHQRPSAAMQDVSGPSGVAQVQEIPDKFICPILHTMMRDPVTTADGFNYERSAIEQWIQRNNTSPLVNQVPSPMTNLPLRHTELKANPTLQTEIRQFARQYPELCANEGDFSNRQDSNRTVASQSIHDVPILEAPWVAPALPSHQDGPENLPRSVPAAPLAPLAPQPPIVTMMENRQGPPFVPPQGPLPGLAIHQMNLKRVLLGGLATLGLVLGTAGLGTGIYFAIRQLSQGNGHGTVPNLIPPSPWPQFIGPSPVINWSSPSPNRVIEPLPSSPWPTSEAGSVELFNASNHWLTQVLVEGSNPIEQETQRSQLRQLMLQLFRPKPQLVTYSSQAMVQGASIRLYLGAQNQSLQEISSSYFLPSALRETYWVTPPQLAQYYEQSAGMTYQGLFGGVVEPIAQHLMPRNASAVRVLLGLILFPYNNGSDLPASWPLFQGVSHPLTGRSLMQAMMLTGQTLASLQQKMPQFPLLPHGRYLNESDALGNGLQLTMDLGAMVARADNLSMATYMEQISQGLRTSSLTLADQGEVERMLHLSSLLIRSCVTEL